MFEGLGRSIVIGTVAAAALGGLWLSARAGAPTAAHPPVAAAPPPAPSASAEPPDDDAEDDGRAYDFRVPSGEPTAIACADARRIVDQVRVGLAYEPDAVPPRAFAESAADWIDPHELWALAVDAPTSAAIEKAAPELLAEIEGRKLDDCAAARVVGEVLARWMGELRADFDAARGEALAGTARGEDAMREPLVAPGAPSVVGRELAASLGRRAGAFERTFGDEGKTYADAARRRFFPELDADAWSRVTLAAAVRAYVPLVDPHGAWAPFDEEASVYEVDLSARPPERLWQSGDFTAVGFRVKDGAAMPLQNGDVVLALDGVPVAGLPLEQLDQLAFATTDARDPAGAVVMRDGEHAPRALSLAPPADSGGGAVERDPLPAERARYGDGDALIVAIHDVRDDLGDQLTRAIRRARDDAEGRALTGVVLDLRGNGGGSTDGAIDALGLFLPGAALFPMKRRDGTVETDRAPEPAAGDRWDGPVATLVDGATASAAEMISGALAVYRRGPSVGAPTYGKGCAQEYVDDDARTGVLRMTTLLYALPDGSPVQRIGITPTFRLPFAGAADDREATLPHAPPTWRGPDVRERRIESPAHAWPSHGGLVGPCREPEVCRALRALGGAAKRAIAAKR